MILVLMYVYYCSLSLTHNYITIKVKIYLFQLSKHLIALQEEHVYLEAAAFAMTPHDLMCDPH